MSSLDFPRRRGSPNHSDSDENGGIPIVAKREDILISLMEKMSYDLKSFREHVDRKIDPLLLRVTGIENRMATLERRVGVLETGHAATNQKLDGILECMQILAGTKDAEPPTTPRAGTSPLTGPPLSPRKRGGSVKRGPSNHGRHGRIPPLNLPSDFDEK